MFKLRSMDKIIMSALFAQFKTHEIKYIDVDGDFNSHIMMTFLTDYDCRLATSVLRDTGFGAFLYTRPEISLDGMTVIDRRQWTSKGSCGIPSHYTLALKKSYDFKLLSDNNYFFKNDLKGLIPLKDKDPFYTPHTIFTYLGILTHNIHAIISEIEMNLRRSEVLHYRDVDFENFHFHYDLPKSIYDNLLVTNVLDKRFLNSHRIIGSKPFELWMDALKCKYSTEEFTTDIKFSNTATLKNHPMIKMKWNIKCNIPNLKGLCELKKTKDSVNEEIIGHTLAGLYQGDKPLFDTPAIKINRHVF